MALIATYDKSQTPWKRRTGIYGHLPKFWRCERDQPGDDEWPGHKACRRWHMSYCGYLSLITEEHFYTFWYQGNPGYRGRWWQIFEKDGTPYPLTSKRLR